MANTETNPVIQKFNSLTGRGQEKPFSVAVIKNIEIIEQWNKSFLKAVLGKTDSEGSESNKVHEQISNKEHWLLRFVIECYLINHINALFKYGDRSLATSLDSDKPVSPELFTPVEFSTLDFPQLKINQSNSEEKVAVNFMKLLQLFEKGKLKLDDSSNFKLYAEWLIQMINQDGAQRNLESQPQPLAPDRSKSSTFTYILTASLSADPVSLKKIQNILTKITSFKIGGTSEPLMTPIKLMQAFWQNFLIALVEPDHPNFTAAQKVFLALTKEYDQKNPTKAVDSIVIIINSLAEGLANRHRSDARDYKLSIPISQWISKFFELQDLELFTSDENFKLELLSAILARWVEDSNNHQNPIISSETALRQIGLYWQTASSQIEALYPHLFGKLDFTDPDITKLLEELNISSKEIEEDRHFATVDKLSGVLAPAIEKIEQTVDKNKLFFPDILTNFSFLKQSLAPISLGAVDLKPLPSLFGTNLVRMIIKPTLQSNESLKFDCMVYFRALKPTAITKEQYLRFTVESTAEGFYLQPDLIELDSPSDILSEVNQKVIYFGLLELFSTYLTTVQTNFETKEQEKITKKQMENNSSNSVNRKIFTASIPITQNQPSKKRQAQPLSQSEELFEPPTPEIKNQHIQINLISSDDTDLANETTSQTEIEFDRALGDNLTTIIRIVNAAIIAWNKSDEFYKLKFIRSQPNKARLKLNQDFRIMLEKKKINGHTRLIITKISKRNEKTYK